MCDLLVRAVANLSVRALIARWSYLMDVFNFNINIAHAANSNQCLSAVDNAPDILQDIISTELVYAEKYFEHPLWS